MKRLFLILYCIPIFCQKISFDNDSINKSAFYNQRDFISFNVNNLNSFDLFIYNIHNIEPFLYLFKLNKPTEEIDDSDIYKNSKLISSSSVAVKNNGKFSVKLKDVLLPNSSYYLIKVRYKDNGFYRYLYQLKIISDIGIIVNNGQNKLLVNVFDIKTALPIQGASVLFYNNSKLISNLYTNNLGGAELNSSQANGINHLDCNMVKVKYYPDENVVPIDYLASDTNIKNIDKGDNVYSFIDNIFYSFDKAQYYDGDDALLVVSSKSYTDYSIKLNNSSNKTNLLIDKKTENKTSTIFSISNLAQGDYEFLLTYSGNKFLKIPLKVIKGFQNRVQWLKVSQSNSQIEIENLSDKKQSIKGYIEYRYFLDDNFSFDYDKPSNFTLFEKEFLPNSKQSIPISDYNYPVSLKLSTSENEDYFINNKIKQIGIYRIDDAKINNQILIPIIAVSNFSPVEIGKINVKVKKLSNNEYSTVKEFAFESKEYLDKLPITFSTPGSYKIEATFKNTTTFMIVNVFDNNEVGIKTDKTNYIPYEDINVSYNSTFEGYSYSVFYINGLINSSISTKNNVGQNSFTFKVPQDAKGKGCITTYTLRKYSQTSKDRSLAYKSNICFDILEKQNKMMKFQPIKVSENNVLVDTSSDYVIGVRNVSLTDKIYTNSNLTKYEIIDINLSYDIEIENKINIADINYGIFYKNSLSLYKSKLDYRDRIDFQLMDANSIVKLPTNYTYYQIFVYLIDIDSVFIFENF